MYVRACARGCGGHAAPVFAERKEILLGTKPVGKFDVEDDGVDGESGVPGMCVPRVGWGVCATGGLRLGGGWLWWGCWGEERTGGGLADGSSHASSRGFLLCRGCACAPDCLCLGCA